MNQDKISLKTRLTSFFGQSRRVWLVLKKPSAQEFKMVSKISALGILVIGALGFFISDAAKVIAKLFG